MSLQTLMLSLLAVVAGALIALQAPLNAGAASRLGHPIAGAALSFTVGTIALLIALVILAPDTITPSRIATLTPMLIFCGGLLGAAFVTSTIVLTPQIGIAAVLALAIAGQVLTSLALDHYALLGLAERSVTAGRAAGAAMVVAGALMVRFL